MAKKIEEKKVMDAVEAAKEMEKIVTEQEISSEQREKMRLIEELEAAEKAGKKVFSESTEERTPDQISLDSWVPKTELGKLVKSGKIKSIDEILESGRKILEAQIVDSLLTLNMELLSIGQAKGKFGGGKRRSWRQTQKKTMEGNVLTFSVMAIVGDANGHVGIGFGRAAETLPAKEKAIRDAKLKIMKVKRGCASYDCLCTETHSIPMVTKGKCSSVVLTLSPAPQGTGLVVGDEIKKILRLAGIRDIYGKSKGKTRTTINVAKATIQALKNLNNLKE